LRKLVLFVATLAVVAALAVLWAVRGSSPGRGIVFEAKVHGLYQLFTINPDGSHLRQITHLVVRNSSIPGVEQAAWSPDGKTIIFDSDYERTKEHVISLFTIGPDGSGLKRVPLYLGQFVGEPAYSPSGKMISFTWDENGSALHQQGIEVANAAGSDAQRLTWVDHPDAFDQRSNWSPDGEWIAYTEVRGPGQSAILKMRPDGTGIVELTPWAMAANNAKWSPDGSRIAFNSHNDPQPGEDANLYTMRPDGTGMVQLTHYAGGKLNAYVGGWSPDGKQIVFHLRGANPDAPGVNQLFILDVDSGHVRQLTNLPQGANPGYASWSPAG